MEAWNQAWLTEGGREEWLTPEPFVVASLPDLQNGAVERVLDLGFGVGRHALLLAQAGFQVAGIEASANGLAYTQAWAAREGLQVELTTGDMTTLPYATGEFDAILTWNVIYHGTMDVIRQTVGEITRCLKPQGYLVCSLISSQHSMAGLGVEIEPRTYVIPGAGEKEHPHHYFNRADIDATFGDYTILRLEDATQKKADDYHWHMLAQRKPQHRFCRQRVVAVAPNYSVYEQMSDKFGLEIYFMSSKTPQFERFSAHSGGIASVWAS